MDEAVIVAADKSASAVAHRYSFGTVWELGQRCALAWSEEALKIDFIPFSYSFTVYPSCDRETLVRAFSCESPGQSTRLAGLLRHVFDDYVLRDLAYGQAPTRLVIVCDGEPDDIDQVKLEVERFVTDKVSASSPFLLEIVTQKPWDELHSFFKHSVSEKFLGYFNSALFGKAHENRSQSH